MRYNINIITKIVLSFSSSKKKRLNATLCRISLKLWSAVLAYYRQYQVFSHKHFFSDCKNEKTVTVYIP